MFTSAKSKSRLGLNVRTIILRGMDAAIKEHDKSSALSYAQKVDYCKRAGKEGDNIQEILSITSVKAKRALDIPEEPTTDGYTLTSHTITGKPMNTVQLKTKARNFLAKNKEFAFDAALLGLGKVVVDTAAAKLPKEVGIFGPLVVAEVVASLPTTNAKIERAQVAALTYAMYETSKSLGLRDLVDTLTSFTEDLDSEI